MSDPISKGISYLLSSIKDDIAESVAKTLDGIVEPSTIYKIINNIYKGLKILFVSSYKSTIGDKTSDAYHMYGSGVGSNLLKFVNDTFKKSLYNLISTVLGGELKQYAKGITTDIYRIILSGAKQSKLGGAIASDKRRLRGQLVAKLMKEEGLTLGQASKKASTMMGKTDIPKKKTKAPKVALLSTPDKRKQRGQNVAKLMKEEGLTLGEASKKASSVSGGVVESYDNKKKRKMTKKPMKESVCLTGGVNPNDKRRLRGQLVAKLMKEKGLNLGDASKEASLILKKN